MSRLDLDLTGRRALVTGAASGIGKATAGCLAALGCRIAAADIDQRGIETLLPTLPKPAEHHVAIGFDLADGSACERTVETAAKRLGGLDIVVHAGATLQRRPLEEVSQELLHTTTAVNMWGTFFLARRAASLMAASSGGSIILFSSQGAYTGGYGGSTVYTMTKAAVGALVKSLAREYARGRVRVNGIAPGAIDTPMMNRDLSQEAIARFVEMIPMNRMGEPREVALCCAFLGSALSGYITGQMLHVNGGQLMV